MRLFKFSDVRIMLAIAAVMPASATIFTDRPNWMTNVTGTTAYDFGLLPSNTTQTFNTSNGLLQQTVGLRIIGFNPQGNYDFSVIQAGPTTQFYNWNSGTIGRSSQVVGGFTLPYVRINFLDPVGVSTMVTAFGIDLATVGVSTGAITVTPQGQTGTTITTQLNPNLTFFGITSTMGFSYIDITPQTANGYAVLDNIAYGTAGTPPDPAPEISTILSVASGLALLIYKRRALNFNLNA